MDTVILKIPDLSSLQHKPIHVQLVYWFSGKTPPLLPVLLKYTTEVMEQFG